VSKAQHDIMARRCDQCLYGADRIVSGQRAAELIIDTRGKDVPFLCHKGTMVGRDVTCHGSLRDTGGGQIGRIATGLGFARWINPDTMEVTDAPEPTNA
jgi:hypothetical protein